MDIISVVTSCDNYDEFKRAMYGLAIQYFREMETEGLVPAGTVDKLLKTTAEDTKDNDILL
jgi:hypothetical protein